MTKIKLIKKHIKYRLKHNKCPFCGNLVLIKSHKYQNYPIKYYISHKVPVKEIDGVDCILSHSVCFTNIKKLIERWEGVYK